MPITLKEIKQQLLKKQEFHLYFSTNSLWWTHCKADIEKITATHKEGFKKVYNNLVSHEMATIEDIDIAGYNFVKQMEVEYYGPSGEPIYVQKNAEKFIKNFEETPYTAGIFGLESFMKVHNDNCNGQIFHNQPEVNKAIAADKDISDEQLKEHEKAFNDHMAVLEIHQQQMYEKLTLSRPQRGMRKPNVPIKKKK